MRKVFLFLMCMFANIGHASSQEAVLKEFRRDYAADADLPGFEASPLMRDILAVHGLRREAYKERLNGAFLAFKTYQALDAAGHAPASHSHSDIKAAVETLHVDRDTHRTNHTNLVGRIQVHGAETQAGVAGGVNDLHSDARYNAHGVRERAAGETDANNAFAARITLGGGEDAAALVAGAGTFHSDAKHTAEVAAANTAGQTAKVAQIATELTALEAVITTQNTDAHIDADGLAALNAEIARIRTAIA